MHVAYFLSKNPFCKKNIKAKKSFKSRIKNVTQCSYRNKKLINLKEILHRNIQLIKKICHRARFSFLCYFLFLPLK